MHGRVNERSVLLSLCAGALWAARANAFCTLESKWPDGRTRMAYNFPATEPLVNGTLSWESNALSAMEEWSSVTGDFGFVDGGSNDLGQNNRDGVNNMIFSSDAAGDAFGDDVLAITLTRSDLSGNSIESDIVFNSDVQWNAYDGPIRVSADGRAIFDFRRVAIHELGHVLGLDHPDTSCGESVDAVMNSLTTDIDRLTDDDRNGVSFLYSEGNQPPVADAGHDQFGDGTQDFVLNGGASFDPDGVIVRYEWFIDEALEARGRVAGIPLRRGMYVVELRVTDDNGATSSDTLIIRVGSEFAPPASDNQPPVARAGEDQMLAVGGTAVLDGSESFDPDGAIERYVWSLSNTILGRDPRILASLSPGTHFITLTVFDELGNATSDTVVVGVGVEEITPSQVDPGGDDGDSQAAPPPVAAPQVSASPCGSIGLVSALGMVLMAASPRAMFARAPL